jgi:CheY-like chemotaxis protein
LSRWLEEGSAAKVAGIIVDGSGATEALRWIVRVRLRASLKSIPVIVVSSQGANELLPTTLNLSPVKIVRSPLVPHTLLQAAAEVGMRQAV